MSGGTVTKKRTILRRRSLIYQDFKKRLLGMEAVFSLVKDSAVRAVHDLIRDLLTAMGRKAVQYSDILF